jgi:hypothetical protein
MGVASAAIDTLQRQQHELGAALDLGQRVPALFLHEYHASREIRLTTWDTLLSASGDELLRQVNASNAVDRLILTGALPYTRAFSLPLQKLPASFVPHHGSMALRQEGLLMLSALLRRREERPELFEQLLHALQRDHCIAREVARLSPALSGAAARSDREEHLFTSVITLMLLLDSAGDLRLWQLMAEADVARTIHQIHLIAPDLPPAPLSRLLEGAHTLQKSLGRAAATFFCALRDFERVQQRTHPLMVGSMRSGV